MKKAGIPIVLLAALVLLSGCTAAGPGDIVTQEKDITDFTSVEVAGTFEVEITHSNIFSVTVSADEDFYDYVTVSKEGDTLRIYLNPRHTFTDFTLQAKTLEAKITMPALYGLRLSGASKGTISGFKARKDFQLHVSGASSINLNDIEVDDLEFAISGASKASGNMTCGDVKGNVSGASEVELKGSANNLTLDASGASKVKLADFTLNNANAYLSGASETTLNVKGRLDSVLSDASSLYFLGNPTMGNISVTGASTIKHK